MAKMIFFPFNFFHLMFSFFIWPFISSCFRPLVYKTPRYLYPPSSIFFIVYPSRILLPSFLITFPVFAINTPHFGNPNCIWMASKKSPCCIYCGYQFDLHFNKLFEITILFTETLHQNFPRFKYIPILACSFLKNPLFPSYN